MVTDMVFNKVNGDLGGTKSAGGSPLFPLSPIGIVAVFAFGHDRLPIMGAVLGRLARQFVTEGVLLALWGRF